MADEVTPTTENGNGEPKHPGGRPTKLTPALQDEIIKAIRAGNYMETAAAYQGIDKTTLYEWLRRGKAASRGIYAEFSHAIEKALAVAEIRDVMNIDNAAKGGTITAKRTIRKESPNGQVTETTEESYAPPQWTASAWRLERKFPASWGRKDTIKTEVSGELKITLVDQIRNDLITAAQAIAGTPDAEVDISQNPMGLATTRDTANLAGE